MKWAVAALALATAAGAAVIGRQRRGTDRSERRRWLALVVSIAVALAWVAALVAITRAV